MLSDRPSRPPLSSSPFFRTSERALVCTVDLESCQVYAHALYGSRRDSAAGHATPARRRRVRAPIATVTTAHAAADRLRSERSPTPFRRSARPTESALPRSALRLSGISAAHVP